MKRVFEGAVQVCLRNSLDEAERQGAGLRVRLRLNDVPELADLPWEYLYNPVLERFLSFVKHPYLRYLELPDPVRPLTVKPPLRILVMIASPAGLPQLDTEHEWATLKDALRSLERRRLIVLQPLEHATLEGVQEQLQREAYHVFHFIGHGGFDLRKARMAYCCLKTERARLVPSADKSWVRSSMTANRCASRCSMSARVHGLREQIPLAAPAKAWCSKRSQPSWQCSFRSATRRQESSRMDFTQRWRTTAPSMWPWPKPEGQCIPAAVA